MGKEFTRLDIRIAEREGAIGRINRIIHDLESQKKDLRKQIDELRKEKERSD